MSTATRESVGESRVVKNLELAIEVDEKKEKNELLEEHLEEVKLKLYVVVDAAKKKEEEINDKGKEIAKEDVVPKLDPTLNKGPLLKNIKTLGGRPWNVCQYLVGRWTLMQ